VKASAMSCLKLMMAESMSARLMLDAVGMPALPPGQLHIPMDRPYSAGATDRAIKLRRLGIDRIVVDLVGIVHEHDGLPLPVEW
jgi:hypothetical protein